MQMKKYRIPGLVALVLAAGLGAGTDAGMPTAVASTSAADGKRPLKSGIVLENIDRDTRPQDDFFQYANGAWLDSTEIPEDEVRYGAWTEVRERNEERLRAILEEAAAADAPAGSDMQKIGDFYRSYMDKETANRLGLDALADELAVIDAAKTHDDLVGIFGRNLSLQLGVPFDYYVDRDQGDTSRSLIYLFQGGLGLPDRDYYFTEGEKFDKIRAEYVDYAERLLELGGQEDSRAAAERIMALETRIAGMHWEAARVRDRSARYNLTAVADLPTMAPGLDWGLFLEGAQISQEEEVVVGMPSFFTGFAAMAPEVSVDDWRTYLRFHLIDGFAYQMSQPFFDARFEFRGRVLRDQQAPRQRWEYALSNANFLLRDAIGRIYLERHFPPEAGDRMRAMVESLRRAFSKSIDELDWMQPQTKAEAQQKLASLKVYVGYSDHWRDYSRVEIASDDLMGNMIRGTRETYLNDIRKLGKTPVDGEFGRGTQEVNASIRPTTGEMFFYAGILQPPFFDLEADDAYNYGAIGAAIGHEMLHAFDDQGRKFDENGELRDWWTPEDAEEYQRRARVMIDQYSRFQPIDGVHINGELTLGENIGDHAGLTMAFRAYRLSLEGTKPPVIDGFTGEQRFFMGFGSVWRMKSREGRLREQLLSGPHSPARYRVIGTVTNMPEFYEAFGVKEGDGHWLPPEERVKIW
jgi:predicted metalloendopeptidase